MAKYRLKLSEWECPDPVGKHIAGKVVATCSNCRVESSGRHPEQWPVRFNKVKFEGNPMFCPVCKYALRYERVNQGG